MGVSVGRAESARESKSPNPSEFSCCEFSLLAFPTVLAQNGPGRMRPHFDRRCSDTNTVMRAQARKSISKGSPGCLPACLPIRSDGRSVFKWNVGKRVSSFLIASPVVVVVFDVLLCTFRLGFLLLSGEVFFHEHC